ncbi:hypothetical protein GDO81_013498 [Engystomops pustulosus]|uniref:Uncharacterized protein n=1 Tax=Engystomops pustulosus TaxID=76066 RepID=A0AAV7B4T0_ENGPU|nr:hypothetical protein GDO81_013498 [Engystomops pustulosus]
MNHPMQRLGERVAIPILTTRACTEMPYQPLIFRMQCNPQISPHYCTLLTSKEMYMEQVVILYTAIPSVRAISVRVVPVAYCY